MGGFRAGPGAVSSDLTGSGGATFDGTTLHVDDDNNRVGIGTTSPVSALHTVGAAQFDANVTLGNAETDVTTVTGHFSASNGFSVPVGIQCGVGTAAPTQALSVFDNRASNYAVSIANDGDNANRYGMVIQAGADDASGTTYYITCKDGNGGTIGYIANTDDTFALATVSDARIKDNIRDTSISGLEIVEEIQVRDFEMKKNGISKTGFIAQELKDIYPDAVTGEEDDIDGDGNMAPMSVSYANLVPALIKSIQELNKNNQDLIARVAELENK